MNLIFLLLVRFQNDFFGIQHQYLIWQDRQFVLLAIRKLICSGYDLNLYGGIASRYLQLPLYNIIVLRLYVKGFRTVLFEKNMRYILVIFGVDNLDPRISRKFVFTDILDLCFQRYLVAFPKITGEIRAYHQLFLGLCEESSRACF